MSLQGIASVEDGERREKKVRINTIPYVKAYDTDTIHTKPNDIELEQVEHTTNQVGNKHVTMFYSNFSSFSPTTKITFPHFQAK